MRRYGLRVNDSLTQWTVFERFIGGTENILATYRDKNIVERQFQKLQDAMDKGILSKELQPDHLQIALDEATNYALGKPDVDLRVK